MEGGKEVRFCLKIITRQFQHKESRVGIRCYKFKYKS